MANALLSRCYDRIRQCVSRGWVRRKDIDSGGEKEAIGAADNIRQDAGERGVIEDTAFEHQPFMKEKPEEICHPEDDIHPSESEECMVEEDRALPETADAVFLKVDVSPIMAELQSIKKHLGTMDASMTAQTESAEIMAHQSETLREMSARVRDLEDDQTMEHVLKPLLRDLLLLHDEVIRSRRQLKAHKEGVDGQIRVSEAFRSFGKEILAMLARHDVTLMQDTTQKLDPHKQKVVGFQESIGSEEATVLSEVRPGFYCGSSVLRHQEVVVHRHRTKEE